VADVNDRLASQLAAHFGYERIEPDWRSLLDAIDVDLVVVCLPPTQNRDVILGAAAVGKHVVSEKPLATSAEVAAELLEAVSGGGVFHGLGAAYRWTPALRAIRAMLDAGSSARSAASVRRSCSTTAPDPDVPCSGVPARAGRRRDRDRYRLSPRSTALAISWARSRRSRA
jgi:predicted dehydrogenase